MNPRDDTHIIETSEELPVLDRTLFQGQHWFAATRSDTLPDVPLGRPAFVMFSLINGEIRRVGIAYSARLQPSQPAPVGLGGDGTAAWPSASWRSR